MSDTETFDTIFRKVFIEWINYSDIERKANKEALKKVCPHTHIISDYVECNADGNGIYIMYCELCNTTFACN
jgi:hypothetical protein